MYFYTCIDEDDTIDGFVNHLKKTTGLRVTVTRTNCPYNQKDTFEDSEE